MGNKTKAELREKMKGAFLEKDEVYFAEANFKINRKLIKALEIKSNVTIGVYLGFSDEPDLNELIVHLQSIPSIKLALPKVNKDQMEFFLFTQETVLQQNKWGINEPQETGEPVVPDIILIPGIAFSHTGKRLGRGLGYFDRYLENSSAQKLGVCFDFQVVKDLPTQPHDQDMDIIIANK